jgi:putative glutamine amidotransferase
MKPRIAIPVPTSTDAEYNQRSWPVYAAAVWKAGGEPIEIPLDEPPATTAKLIAGCHGVLLPGSGADVNPQKFGHALDPDSAPADPARENVDELLLQDAHNLRKPIFAVCFGAQMLNVWRGGSLIQHLDPDAPGATNHRQKGVGDAHQAAVEPNSLLGEAISAGDGPLDEQRTTHNAQLIFSVNSSHHQAIDKPGDGLRVSARSPDDGVVEAIENVPGAPGGFVLGVQWHPERTYDSSAASRALFSRFISEAAKWEPKPNAAE